MSISFKVEDVEMGTRVLEQYTTVQELCTHILSNKSPTFEANSKSDKLLTCGTFNSFAYAAETAYSKHYPLTISPDHIWLLLLQGVSNHINLNAETLKSRLVTSKDVVDLLVNRDHFVRGNPDNDWQGVMAEFIDQMGEHLTEKAKDKLIASFSTTGVVEQCAFNMTLMTAMQSFFTYTTSTMCGIPEITLEGEASDWERIRSNANFFEELDLEWWTKYLFPILDEFVEAANGNANSNFWKSFYKTSGGSGGPWINGQIRNLFPYLKEPPYRDKPDAPDLAKNQHLGAGLAQGIFSCGPKMEELPSGLSKVPMVWNYYGNELQMELVSGFVGYTQDSENKSVKANLGWAMAYK